MTLTVQKFFLLINQMSSTIDGIRVVFYFNHQKVVLPSKIVLGEIHHTVLFYKLYHMRKKGWRILCPE